MLKRKIVKVVHKNGQVDYKVKKRIFPFIWVTDSFEYWYGVGICTVVCNGMTLEQAKDYIENLKKQESEDEGSKVVEETDL